MDILRTIDDRIGENGNRGLQILFRVCLLVCGFAGSMLILSCLVGILVWVLAFIMPFAAAITPFALLGLILLTCRYGLHTSESEKDWIVEEALQEAERDKTKEGDGTSKVSATSVERSDDDSHDATTEDDEESVW